MRWPRRALSGDGGRGFCSIKDRLPERGRVKLGVSDPETRKRTSEMALGCFVTITSGVLSREHRGWLCDAVDERGFRLSRPP